MNEKKSAKKYASDFMKRYKITKPNVTKLRQILASLGFTIVDFNNGVNDEHVQIILSELRIEEQAKQSKGFTYVDSNYRLVFIHEDLSDDEMAIVLAHEIGHIYCGHFGHSCIMGKDISEEYEANEFAHYILNPPLIHRVSAFMRRKRVLWLILAVVFIVASAVFLTIFLTKNDNSKKKDGTEYYKEYYVSISGKRYHVAGCHHIDGKEKKRLTVDDIKSDSYQPCEDCIK